MQELVGSLAAFLTTVAFVPQAYKIYKTNQTKDLSLSLFLIFSSGVFMWLIYGIMIKDFPIMIANTITLFLSLYILYKKISIDKIEKSI
ncbi:SemiSWEET family sugar transporter [Arcobacter sp. s6]|uniref:SemiSWEET family sugar transporter n=1 Tax=Arcobacter sp. s6 TaxID=3230363 RepID=UPI0034A02B0A